MSGYLADDCGGPDVVLEGHPQFGLVALEVGFFRQYGQMIVRDETGGPGHVLIVGNKSKSAQNAFARAARWIVEPK